MFVSALLFSVHLENLKKKSHKFGANLGNLPGLITVHLSECRRTFGVDERLDAAVVITV